MPAILVVDRTLAAGAAACSLIVGIGSFDRTGKLVGSPSGDVGLNRGLSAGLNEPPFASNDGDCTMGNLNSDSVSDPSLGETEMPCPGVFGTVAVPDCRL